MAKKEDRRGHQAAQGWRVMEKHCYKCGNSLRSKGAKLYCSKVCFMADRSVTKQCPYCRRYFSIPKCHAHRVQRCSSDCRYKSRRSEKGIEYKGIWYSLPKDFGYYYNTQKRSLLHRALWEESNGPIPIGYDIHHKNGIKTDNRLENLELISHQEHTSSHNKERHAKRRALLVK
jgi:hypothetical protein